MALHATSSETTVAPRTHPATSWRTALARLPRRGSIATRMVCFAIALVGLTALLIGTLSYERARRALETTATTRLVLLARDVAAAIGRELENRAADITNWSRLEVMRALLYADVDKELAQFLEQSRQGRPTYVALLALDDQGRVVASAGDAAAARPHARSSRARLTTVPGGRRTLLQYETVVAHPDRPDDVIGMLVVLLDPSRLADRAHVPGLGVASDVSLTLRERSGGVVATSAGADARRSAGDVVRAVAPVALSAIESPPLEVELTERSDAAFADVASLKATLIQTGALVVALGAVLAALAAWRIGLPIRRLTATVREVGDSRTLEAGMPAFPDDGGEVAVLVSAFRGMMDSLATAQRENLVQSRLALLGEIAANVAHEVRTPLSVLKTSAQLLARGGLPEAEQRELASTAAAEVDRLNAVVTTLVDLARPKPVRHAPQRIAPIVDRAVSFFRPLAEKASIAVARDGAQPDATVHASADQLHQVLLNLLQNALQASRPGGTITVRCDVADGFVTVAVDDTGSGFPSELLPRVFSPFVTTKADGAGLGLAIVKRMVEEHGGTVGAENRSTGGARVWIRLPVRRGGA